MTDPPDEELLGIDAPRSLPPDLRARLEDALLTTGSSGDAEGEPDPVAVWMAGIDSPRPVPEPVRRRLEAALASGQATQAGTPGPPPPSLTLRRHRPARVRRPGTTWQPWAAAAAVLAVMALGVTLAFSLGQTRSGTTAASGGPARTARSSATRSGPDTAAGAGGASALPVAGPFATGGAGGTAAPAGAPAPLSPAAGAGGAAEGAGSAGAAARSAPPPTVTKVSPPAGPSIGGNWVTVSGTSLTGVRAVRFGSVAASRFIVQSPGQLMALAPAEAPGTVDVVVVSSAGNSAAGPADHYTFV
ncbi:MAG TPA: IPT/TIG domain-containing protein [Acidimicrobiales bacterium]|nr:IPT/TIG domain-containing protein [Acidimicrobiales bacterium]